MGLLHILHVIYMSSVGRRDGTVLAFILAARTSSAYPSLGLRMWYGAVYLELVLFIGSAFEWYGLFFSHRHSLTRGVKMVPIISWLISSAWVVLALVFRWDSLGYMYLVLDRMFSNEHVFHVLPSLRATNTKLYSQVRIQICELHQQVVMHAITGEVLLDISYGTY